MTEPVPINTTEETDIDAVDTSRSGSDHLEFTRGVTDLDAVGKEMSGLLCSKVYVSLSVMLLFKEYSSRKSA